MNCTEVMANMGFECAELSEKMLRVWSPFTYGNDGEVIGFYVERVGPDKYRVTDGAASLRHAASMGIGLNRKRIEALRAIAGPDANVSDGGEISAAASELGLTDAIAAVLNAALAVSHLEFGWRPRTLSETFTAEVETNA